MSVKTCPRCGAVHPPAARVCNCGASWDGDVLAAPATSTAVHILEPIGGWLVLVGLGLAFTPIRQAVVLGRDLVPSFRDGTWTALTTPGDAYNPMLGALLVGEVLASLSFLAGGVALLVLFFRRSRRFPPLFIAFMTTNFAVVVADAWVASVALESADQQLITETVAEGAKEGGRSLFQALIWVPNMLVSKRVKKTFVR